MVHAHVDGFKLKEDILDQSRQSEPFHSRVSQDHQGFLRSHFLNRIEQIIEPSYLQVSRHRIRKLRKNSKMIYILNSFKYHFIKEISSISIILSNFLLIFKAVGLLSYFLLWILFILTFIVALVYVI